MKRHVLSLKCGCAIPFAVSVFLFHGSVHAQTIESQDTRTFQDSRAQDGRQSPTVIPPGETERLKKLTEKAILPEDTGQAAPAETQGNSKRESEPSRSYAPTTKQE
ncbi:hypothetical protein [Nitrospira sp. Nam74]